MTELKDIFQTADWKQEKHMPVIKIVEKARKGEFALAEVSVGKEIVHPNTTEHHIRWIEVYFLPQGEKFPCQLGRFEFTAHGESAQGPNTSSIYSHPEAIVRFKTEKPGTIIAFSYCNIHGLWQDTLQIGFE